VSVDYFLYIYFQIKASPLGRSSPLLKISPFSMNKTTEKDKESVAGK
jgi:hypothetical protein